MRSSAANVRCSTPTGRGRTHASTRMDALDEGQQFNSAAGAAWGASEQSPAQLNVVGLPARAQKTAGGSIRNIALNAAFIAAEADKPVCMSHLLQAARAEYAKLEKPLTELELAAWRTPLVTRS